MDTETLKHYLHGAGYQTRPYSGRGMYGAVCLAFEVQTDEETLVGAVANIVAIVDDADEREQLADEFARARTDSMGRDGVVVYFPRQQVER